MKAGPYIAIRYLFAKKSHNVINVISAISSIGMAIGTAALILILSVYNGFDKIIEDNMSDLDSDILVKSASSRYFTPDESLFDAIADNPDVAGISEVLQENVFISYGEKQGIALAKGVDAVYAGNSPISKHIVDGKFSLMDNGRPQVCAGIGIATEMGIRPHFVDRLVLYYPKSGPSFPLLGIGSSMSSIKVSPSSLFSINSSVDDEMIILPIESMRELLGSEDLVSGIEIRLKEGYGKKIVQTISKTLGPDYSVLDRYSQNPSIYKMMRYEKFAVIMILIFVIIIISFNIFSSLSMLIIEKKDDIIILKAMGASDRLIKQIFVLEGWFISLFGLAIGLLIGIALTFAQQEFGLVKMPGNFSLIQYPVLLEFSDILLTAASVALIGLATASIPTLKKRPDSSSVEGS